jgi:hypothetical protein
MPKQQTFDFVVDGAPEDVAERLKAKTRFRPFPYQASILGGGKKPLGGLVTGGGFRVALDPRSVLQHSQAVAVGSLEPRSDGRTRVHGVAGLPAWTTWLYRIVFLLMGAAVAAGGTIVAAETGLSPAAVMGVGGMMFVLGTLLGIPLLGWHVAKADEQVDGVVERLEEAVGAAPAVLPSAVTQSTTTESASAADDILERAQRAAAARDKV